MIGSTELIIIVLIVFILFGAKSIPKFAKSIGEARKEFQKGMDDLNPNLDSEPHNTKRIQMLKQARLIPNQDHPLTIIHLPLNHQIHNKRSLNHFKKCDLFSSKFISNTPVTLNIFKEGRLVNKCHFIYIYLMNRFVTLL